MKRTILSLIRAVFSDLTTSEINALTEADRRQLGSAIARQQGLVPEQVDFDIVPYD